MVYIYIYIDEKTLKYLIPDSPKPGRFYLLTKIHKANNPGRPIVSANGHSTEKISEFVDFHLRQRVETLPSFIKDTTISFRLFSLQMIINSYQNRYYLTL